jgi:hypothetical protein
MDNISSRGATVLADNGIFLEPKIERLMLLAIKLGEQMLLGQEFDCGKRR